MNLYKNISKKEIHKLRHTDSALRYLPIVKDIERFDKDVKILEVGAGDLGIYPYLKRPIYAVDINYRITYEEVTMIVARAEALPFRDKTFGIVIAVDVLEHIPPQFRKKAIQEIIRVTGQRLYLAFPTGITAEKHDKKYHEYFIRKRGMKYPFFEDHIKYGLPSEAFVEQSIIEFTKLTGRNISISKNKNANIIVRNFLMFLWINQFNLLYKYTLHFSNLLQWFNIGKCYRSLLIIQFHE